MQHDRQTALGCKRHGSAVPGLRHARALPARLSDDVLDILRRTRILPKVRRCQGYGFSRALWFFLFWVRVRVCGCGGRCTNHSPQAVCEPCATQKQK
jgi:hypothetical protein